MTHDPREALEDARRLIAQLLAQPVGDPRNAESIVTLETCLPYGFVAWAKKHRPALTASSPGEQKPVAHRIRVVDGSYCKVIPEGELEIWKQNWSTHLKSGHALLEPLYLSPPPAAGWDEAIEAALSILQTCPIRYYRNNSSGILQHQIDGARADVIEAVKALRREAPAPRGVDRPDAGGGVRVKSLEWNEYEREGDIDEWDAETALGTFYSINMHAFCFMPSYDRSPIHNQGQQTLEEAKAVCQADYERRIRSALSNPPAAVESNASAEARLREETHLDACREKLSALRERERQKMNAASDRAERAASTGDMTEVSISSTESERHRQALSVLNAAFAEFDKLYEALSPAVGDEAKKSEGGRPLHLAGTNIGPTDYYGYAHDPADERRHPSRPESDWKQDQAETTRIKPSDPPDRREIVARIDARARSYDGNAGALYSGAVVAKELRTILAALDGGR